MNRSPTQPAPGAELPVEVSQACSAERGPAVQVWYAANHARGHPPAAARVARVQQKVREVGSLLVVARVDTAVVGMALAEAARTHDGTGAPVPGHGHLAMVFVAPPVWGRGVGTALLQGVHHRAAERGWSTLTVWTRHTNTAAQHLYTRAGYHPTGRTASLPSGELIVQLRHTGVSTDSGTTRT